MAEVKTVFIIGDEAASYDYITDRINPANQIGLENSCLSFQIFPFLPNCVTIQAYFFPRDRDLKQYCTLYTQSLKPPHLVIYAVDVDSSAREISEWLDLLDSMVRIAFFSDAQTYSQRQQIFKKLGPLFRRDISQHTFFPKMDHASMSTCLCNLGEVGIFMHHYARKVPIVTKIRWAWRKLCEKLFAKKSECESVI